MEKVSFSAKKPRVGPEFQVEVLPQLVDGSIQTGNGNRSPEHPADLVFAPESNDVNGKLIPRPTQWSSAEAVNYGRCFRKHAQDFARYREHLPNKSMAEILDLFYKREGIKIYRRALTVQKILANERTRCLKRYRDDSLGRRSCRGRRSTDSS